MAELLETGGDLQAASVLADRLAAQGVDIDDEGQIVGFRLASQVVAGLEEQLETARQDTTRSGGRARGPVAGTVPRGRAARSLTRAVTTAREMTVESMTVARMQVLEQQHLPYFSDQRINTGA